MRKYRGSSDLLVQHRGWLWLVGIAVCLSALLTPRAGFAQDDTEPVEDPGSVSADTGDEDDDGTDTPAADDGPEPVNGETISVELGAGGDTPEATAPAKPEDKLLALFKEPIPPPHGAERAKLDEYSAYRASAERYLVEVGEYRRQLSGVVVREYNAKLAEIDRVYQGQIDEARGIVRDQRHDGIVRLELFLAKHATNPRYAPGVMYRLAVLHYELAYDDFYSADPDSVVGDYPDYSQSIAYSRRLINDYPEFQQVDGAYYLLGFCLSQMEDKDGGNDAFMALVEKRPDSSKAPEAYTRIGEYHFERSQEAVQGLGGETRWEIAKEYYEKAAAYGPDYAIFDRALYRLAWAEYYMEDYDSMIHRFIALVEYADRVPQGSALRQEAIEFMAAALAEEDWNLEDDIPRDPDFGMTRFDKYLSTGQPFEFEVLRVYADTLTDQSRHDYAAEAYAALLARDDCNPSNPQNHQALITALNLSDQRETAIAMQSQLDRIYGRGSRWYQCQEQDGNLEAIAFAESMTRKAFRYSISSYKSIADELDAEHDALQPQIADARSAEQRDALIAQDEDVRLKSLEAYAKTAEVTNDYLERYPNDQDVYLYRYIVADAFYRSEQYEKAGESFEMVRDLSDGRFRRPAATDAVAAYEIMLVESVESAGHDPRGLPPDVIRQFFDRGLVAPADVPTYLIEEIYAEGVGDIPAIEAELEQRKTAERAPMELPPLVASLVAARDKYVEYNLDSRRAEGEDTIEEDYRYLNAVIYYHYDNFEEARPRFEEIMEKHPDTEFAMVSAGFLINTYHQEGDLDKVTELTDRIQKMNLGSGKSAEEFGTKLQEIKYGALFDKAKQLFENEQYAEAAYEYERIVDENPGFSDIHLALYNAGVAYERVQRYESAMRLYRRLYTEYNDKPEAADALWRVGLNGERFFDFDAAVDAYIELHDTDRESFTNHPERVGALRKAAIILKYQENYERAAKLFQRYAKEHSEQPDAPNMLFEAGLAYESMDDFRRMAEVFDKFGKAYGRDPELRALVLQSYVMQGDYFKKRDRFKRARLYYGKAADLYQSNPGAGGRDANYLAAKSQFMLADMDFREWSEITFEGSLTTFKKRIQAKKEGATTVAARFNQVKSYQNPEWTMAALYRIGSMLHNFATSMESAKCPSSFDEFTCDGMLESLLEASFELKEQARGQYEAVVQFGRDNGIVNDWTRRSLNGLNDIAPKEFPVFETDRWATQKSTVSPSSLLSPAQLAAEAAGELTDAKDLEEK